MHLLASGADPRAILQQAFFFLTMNWVGGRMGCRTAHSPVDLPVLGMCILMTQIVHKSFIFL